MNRFQKIVEPSILILTVWLLLYYAYLQIVYELLAWYAFMLPDDYTGPLPMRFPIFNVEQVQQDIEWTVSVFCPLILYLPG